MRKRVLILISGRGSNMRSVVQSCATEAWNAEVVGVVSNRPEAAGLEWAAQQGLNTHVLDHKAFATREAFDAALMALCDGQRPDVLLLAGFMRVLTEAFVTHYAGRLVNIHPSLLPAFPGLHTHRQALAAGVKLAGATVHLVTPRSTTAPSSRRPPCRCGPTTPKPRWPSACCWPNTASCPRRCAGWWKGASRCTTAWCRCTRPNRSSCCWTSPESRPAMHPQTQVNMATELVRRVLGLVNPADREVSDFFREHKGLGPRDRAILAETTFKVLRQRLVLQHLAQSGQGPLPRRLVLLAWQGSEAYLKAGVTEPEWQWLQGVRQVNTNHLPGKVQANMPEWLMEPLKASLGTEWPAFLKTMDQPAPLDLRVNTFKAKREALLAELHQEGYPIVATPHSPWGLRLEGKPSLQNMPAFVRGDVEVQDEGSQLLALLTDAHRGEMVVDFCAGAGGKTLALGASMRNTGRLYAFDTSAHRLSALKPRLARSGLSNVHPVHIAHERDERIKRLAGKIDRVLVDAPCSGLGTLRRNPDLKWRQSPASVEELCGIQGRILASAARLVKPGGRLVYATCSLLDAENEGAVERFLAEHPGWAPLPVQAELERLKVDTAAGLVSGPFLRLWPHRHGTDGFFAAVFTRQ